MLHQFKSLLLTTNEGVLCLQVSLGQHVATLPIPPHIKDDEERRKAFIEMAAVEMMQGLRMEHHANLIKLKRRNKNAAKKQRRHTKRSDCGSAKRIASVTDGEEGV